MTDTAKLKAAAEKAQAARTRLESMPDEDVVLLENEGIKSDVSACNKFISAAHPGAVLELIAQNAALVAAHMNLKLLADVYRQAYEEALEARNVTVELPRGYAGPYGSLVYDADAVEAALEDAERQKGYLREQCNEWERKAISNFENCSEMAARIEELESQRQMAFMASNRWADKFREAEKRIAELEERNAEILRQARSFREAHESASEIIRRMERSKPVVTLPTTRLWAGKVACFEEGEVISALVAAGINLETGGE